MPEQDIQEAMDKIGQIPGLAEKAGERALRTVTSKMRQIIQRDLRRTIRSETLKKRVFRQVGLIWLGANPVFADHVKGAVEGSGRNITVDGRSGNFFCMPTAGGFVTMERYGKGRKDFRRAMVDISPLVNAAFAKAEAKLEPLFLTAFDSEVQKQLERL